MRLSTSRLAASPAFSFWLEKTGFHYARDAGEVRLDAGNHLQLTPLLIIFFQPRSGVNHTTVRTRVHICVVRVAAIPALPPLLLYPL